MEGWQVSYGYVQFQRSITTFARFSGLRNHDAGIPKGTTTRPLFPISIPLWGTGGHIPNQSQKRPLVWYSYGQRVRSIRLRGTRLGPLEAHFAQLSDRLGTDTPAARCKGDGTERLVDISAHCDRQFRTNVTGHSGISL